MNIKITSKDSKFYEEFMKALKEWNGTELELWGKYWTISSLQLEPPFEVNVELTLLRTIPVKENVRTVEVPVPCDLPHYPSNPYYPGTFTGGLPNGTFICTGSSTDLDVTRGAQDCSGLMFKCTNSDINHTDCGASGLLYMNHNYN